MRIDKLTLGNFKAFTLATFQFNPHFNLVVGVNGMGKTSLLHGLEVAIAAWQYAGGFRSRIDQRQIENSEIRLEQSSLGERPQLEPQFPVVVQATGAVLGKRGTWTRSRHGVDDATNIKSNQIYFYDEVGAALQKVQSGQAINLPLIASYGAGRLWHDYQQTEKPDEVTRLSRLFAYSDAFHTRMSAQLLTAWIQTEELAAFKEGAASVDKAGSVVKNAILACLEGARRLWFDPRREQLVIAFDNGRIIPFSNLSDGQRTILTLVGDIARRAITLNPHLQNEACARSEGIVLIDELDLHLHPRWQRRIISDLQRTFPSLQFVCTTHSPQLIGQAQADQIILLTESGQVEQPSQSFGMDSNWILRHIMGSEDRDLKVSEALDDLFELIESNQLPSAQTKVDSLRTELGEHPDLVEAQALIHRFSREQG
jgi:predicted ATP-binding protein involved in virulence